MNRPLRYSVFAVGGLVSGLILACIWVVILNAIVGSFQFQDSLWLPRTIWFVSPVVPAILLAMFIRKRLGKWIIFSVGLPVPFVVSMVLAMFFLS